MADKQIGIKLDVKQTGLQAVDDSLDNISKSLSDMNEQVAKQQEKGWGTEAQTKELRDQLRYMQQVVQLAERMARSRGMSLPHFKEYRNEIGSMQRDLSSVPTYKSGVGGFLHEKLGEDAARSAEKISSAVTKIGTAVAGINALGTIVSGLSRGDQAVFGYGDIFKRMGGQGSASDFARSTMRGMNDFKSGYDDLDIMQATKQYSQSTGRMSPTTLKEQMGAILDTGRRFSLDSASQSAQIFSSAFDQGITGGSAAQMSPQQFATVVANATVQAQMQGREVKMIDQLTQLTQSNVQMMNSSGDTRTLAAFLSMVDKTGNQGLIQNIPSITNAIGQQIANPSGGYAQQAFMMRAIGQGKMSFFDEQFLQSQGAFGKDENGVTNLEKVMNELTRQFGTQDKSRLYMMGSSMLGISPTQLRDLLDATMTSDGKFDRQKLEDFRDKMDQKPVSVPQTDTDIQRQEKQEKQSGADIAASGTTGLRAFGNSIFGELLQIPGVGEIIGAAAATTGINIAGKLGKGGINLIKRTIKRKPPTPPDIPTAETGFDATHVSSTVDEAASTAEHVKSSSKVVLDTKSPDIPEAPKKLEIDPNKTKIGGSVTTQSKNFESSYNMPKTIEQAPVVPHESTSGTTTESTIKSPSPVLSDTAVYDGAMQTFRDVGKIVGKGAEVIAVASAVADVAVSENKKRAVMKNATGLGGMYAGGEIGAGIGAGIGTAIFPGIGTVVGGAVGGLVGGAAGFIAGEFVGDKAGSVLFPDQHRPMSKNPIQTIRPSLSKVNNNDGFIGPVLPTAATDTPVISVDVSKHDHQNREIGNVQIIPPDDDVKEAPKAMDAQPTAKVEPASYKSANDSTQMTGATLAPLVASTIVALQPYMSQIKNVVGVADTSNKTAAISNADDPFNVVSKASHADYNAALSNPRVSLASYKFSTPKSATTSSSASQNVSFSPVSTRSTTEQSNVTAEQINNMLNGTDLAGHGQDFISAATKYGINPSALVGLVRAEQNFSNPYGSNNLTGITSDMGLGDGRMFGANDGQPLPGFESIEKGLEAAAKNLQKYQQSGVTNIDDVAKKWVGNNNWKTESSTIQRTMDELEGQHKKMSDDDMSKTQQPQFGGKIQVNGGSIDINVRTEQGVQKVKAPITAQYTGLHSASI